MNSFIPYMKAGVLLLFMLGSLHSFAQDTLAIQEVEYFFDTDPGYGSGTTIPVTADTIISIDPATLNAAGLSTGFHVLYVRARNIPELESYNTLDTGTNIVEPDFFVNNTLRLAGQWGMAESRLVYVNESSAAEIQIVDQIEYFFDTDPGVGNGIPTSAFTASTIVNQAEPLVSDTLASGFHVLFMRAREQGGAWGLYDSRLVYIDQSLSGEIQIIDQIEYFYDEDPGVGNGIPTTAFTADSIVSIQDVLTADTLATGFHVLFLRARAQGGSWGLYDSRLVYVDASSANQVQIIDQIEYFYDVDPGYGNGIPTTAFLADSIIALQDTLIADTLSAGFHTLFIRAKTSDNVWGIYQSSLVYIDEAGSAIIYPIDELEYFFDDDPGFGLGQAIPVSPPDTSVLREFFISTAALTEGAHVLHVRARNTNGNWGILESFPFTTYGLGRELDSAALAYAYSQLDGTNWTNSTNWLTTAIDTWYGVTVVNGRVDSVDLRANNLSGQVPFQLSYLSAAKKIDLAENNLMDTIPDPFVDLVSLQELYLHDNALNEIPDMSSIGGLTTLSLDTNFFDFGDLEPLVGITNLTYANQELYDEVDIDSIVSIGQLLTIDPEVEGVNNIYQWFLNGDTIPAQDLPAFNLASFSASDTGSYQLKIQNSLITDLEIISPFYTAILNDFDQDSLALVSLYSQTNGPAWTASTGWLSDSLSNWQGVTLADRRVIGLSLPSNNLDGTLPDDFIYADSLITLDLSDNLIQDTIPDNFVGLGVIETINVANNDITSLPVFNTVPSLQTLDVSGNKLQFGDLEANLGIPTFNYSPQDSISSSGDTIVDRTSTVPLSFDVTGSNNIYQWYKDNQAISGATTETLTISGVEFSDEGIYRLEINNTIVSGLTLTSGELQLKVSSLTRDSIALRAVYDATGGADWIATVNWTSAPITDWDSITIANDRVTEVSLNSSGIAGDIPVAIRDITSLETLLLRDNSITGIPNLSQMPSLTSLDIRENNLEMDDLEPNVNVTGLEIDPQKEIPVAQTLIVVNQGESVTLSYDVGGANNIYALRQDKSKVAYLGEGEPAEQTVSTNPTYTIDSVTFDDMGDYFMQITSPVIDQVFPDFALFSETSELLALANCIGTVNGVNGATIEGIIYALYIDPEGGPYDTIFFDQQNRIPFDVTASDFTMNDLILGDYILLTDSDDDDVYIPTYTGNTEDWVFADTIFLRDDFTVTNYNLVPIPGALAGEGTLNMLVESDFAEESEGGRIDARRRVKKAGCSLRRRVTGGGRTDQDADGFELIAYKETDDDGNVSFGQLPVGEYRINIQYPGIPLDPDSYTSFEIKEGEERTEVTVAATVREEGITIELVQLITAYQKYFRNLDVYPNPAQDYFQIRYDRLLTDDVRVKLTDMQGKVLKDIAIERGYMISKEIEVADLDKGVYLLYFYDPNITEGPLSIFKVIITK